MIKIDSLVKSFPSRHPGESRGPEVLGFLDSGFRRNDRKGHFLIFCEVIKIVNRNCKSG
jgi:hypothetical protein